MQAIGSFLAEIGLSNGKGGIVFDNQVSSLDHRRRELVARHLAAEAALTLLQDYRSGALGRISLETPESRSTMLSRQAPAQTEETQEAGMAASDD